ncbi:hypothetical protein NRY67_04660, partial [Acidithiobacillus ferrooxidans]
LNAPGHEHARMKGKLMDFLDLDRSEQAKLPAPALLRRISSAIGCSSRIASMIIQSREDPKLRAAITFQPNPATLADLVLWDVVHDFFEEKCRGKSEKSAWTKAILGYKTKDGIRMPGLADEIGEIPALAAFYVLNTGLKGLNRVMSITGWTWEHINELLATATLRINHFLSKIGRKLLKSLQIGVHGVMFSIALMSAIAKGEAAKKVKKAKKTTIHKIIASDTTDADEINEDEDDDLSFGNTDPDNEEHDQDPQDEDPRATHEPVGFDNPEAPQDEDLDGDGADDTDEPPKTPRAVAFYLLESTRMRLERIRQRSPGEQRLLDLLDMVDPPRKMVDALQKGGNGDNDPQVDQRMADCLSLAWQWAHRTGIFTAIPKHGKYLDMPAEQFLAALIAGVRGGYLAPDEAPKPPKPKPKKGKKREADGSDPGREWIQVLDWETKRVARVTRSTPPGDSTLPGTSIQIHGDDEIIATFLHHVRMSFPIKRRKNFNGKTTRLRFWAATSMDGLTQVITCEVEKHASKRSIEHQVEDIETVIPVDGLETPDDVSDLDQIQIQEDLISFADLQALSRLLKLPPTRIKEGLTGDAEAMDEIRGVIQAMAPDERDDAQDMVLRMLRLDQEYHQEASDNSLRRLAG